MHTEQESQLNVIQAEQLEWRKRNFPTSIAPWVPLLGVQEELGELSHAYLKMWQGIRGAPEEHMAAIRDAVGDLSIYLIDFCNMMGISYEDCLTETWNQVKQRDWIKYPNNGVSE